MGEEYLVRREVVDPKHHRGSDLLTPLQEVRNIGSPAPGENTVPSSWLDASPAAAFPTGTSPRHAARSAAAPTAVESYAQLLYVPCEAEHAVEAGNRALLWMQPALGEVPALFRAEHCLYHQELVLSVSLMVSRILPTYKAVGDGSLTDLPSPHI